MLYNSMAWSKIQQSSGLLITLYIQCILLSDVRCSRFHLESSPAWQPVCPPPQGQLELLAAQSDLPSSNRRTAAEISYQIWLKYFLNCQNHQRVLKVCHFQKGGHQSTPTNRDYCIYSPINIIGNLRLDCTPRLQYSHRESTDNYGIYKQK